LRFIEECWVKGEIDDCQCIGEHIALIEGNWQKIVNVLDNIKIDPYFKSFIAQCKNAGMPVYIGSNGIDKVLSHILTREGIEVSGSWAYHLIESDKGWALEFPKDKERGICQVPHSIACKCALLEASRLAKITSDVPYKIVIGDSKSDFCWANKADFVFGKKKLAQYCDEQNIDHLPFSDFSHISEYMTKYEIFDRTASI
jgi:2-hydroxy-3-keto-5-methylthiopentenyl-1-phosphate phosphatase